MPPLQKASIDKISALLHLPPRHPHMQDWELEYADPERLEEMVLLYNTLTDAEDKLALMALLVGSLDDFIASQTDSFAMTDVITSLLVADWELHHKIVRYWALLNHELIDGGFPVTPLMRELWAEENTS